MIRDMLLLPWVLLLSERVILYFHAAGIADRLEQNPRSSLNRLVSFLYGKAFAGIVMTNFNRRDPEAVGVRRVLVVPYRIKDDFDPLVVRRGDIRAKRILYVGHLCPDKGTPELLRAFALVRRNHPEIQLSLMGECLPPFTQRALKQLIADLHVQPFVQVLGVLRGRAKAEEYGKADLFIFPTLAPYESFGIVLAEAMSWALPIVASKWRGNSDVLTSQAGAICFPVSSSFAEDIAAALEQALGHSDEWPEWGKANRSVFRQRYCEDDCEQWLVESLLPLIVTKG
jgi:glycosyltransferase involved in cell wall biosynthesis